MTLVLIARKDTWIHIKDREKLFYNCQVFNPKYAWFAFFAFSNCDSIDKLNYFKDELRCYHSHFEYNLFQLKKEQSDQEDGRLWLKQEPLNLVPWKLRLYWIILLPVTSILLRILSKTCIQLSWHITTWKLLPLILCNQLCRIFCPNLLTLDLVVIVFCGQFVFLFFF